MTSKYDFLNLTESNQFMSLINENATNLSLNDPFIPLQTEAYLGVIKNIYLII